MSCMGVFYLTASLALVGLPAVPAGGPNRAADLGGRSARPDPFASADRQPTREDPDALYAQREDLAAARRAADIWARRLAADAHDFEAAWKLARASYWLGSHVPEAERRATYERGIAAARAAVAAQPDRPEGHFWLAANMGALAEAFGLRQGLKYRAAVKTELETVLRIDPAYQQGSADRALGRWYQRVPRLFGGNDRLAEWHLRRSLDYNPNSTASRYFLAETLLEMGRTAEARAELERVLAAPLDPEWAPEDREFKAKARALLERLAARPDKR
jgi:tetratricopeptide (TPR) repeat protein